MSDPDELIYQLAYELATELDLHYEEEDFFALKTSIDKLVYASQYLRKRDKPVPEPVSFVINRYKKACN